MPAGLTDSGELDLEAPPSPGDNQDPGPLPPAADEGDLPARLAVPPAERPTPSTFARLDDNTRLRRQEVERRHQLIVRQLEEHQIDGVLLAQPDHLSWLTVGGLLEVPDRALGEGVAIFVSRTHRCLVCRHEHAARLLAEELDQLGFLIKEVPWYQSMPLLCELLAGGKTVAADWPGSPVSYAPNLLDPLLEHLASVDENRYLRLGMRLCHAIEATLRSLTAGQAGWEVLGQLTHRLVHHGLEPVQVFLAADGQLRHAGRYVPGPGPIQQACNLLVTARRRGMYATAARTVVLDSSDADRVSAWRQQADNAAAILAQLTAASQAGATVDQALRAGMAAYAARGREFDWRETSLGALTGYRPPQQPILPGADTLLAHGSVISWTPAIGGLVAAQTLWVTATKAVPLQFTEQWPTRADGYPDLLVRS